MPFSDEDFLAVCEQFRAEHQDKTSEALTARYNEVVNRMAELDGYARRSGAQDEELSRLHAEMTVLDVAISDRRVLARSPLAAERAGKIAEISRTAQNPANCEGPAAGPAPYGRSGPALVRDARRDRLETPQEVVQRAGNPWRDGDGGPLNRETGDGLAARAHAAVEALSERLTHDGAEKLAGLLSLRPLTVGPYEVRNAEDIKRSAELVLALSNPFYESAFRSILRWPEAFRNGTGILMWSDEERLAYGDVMACRSTLLEDSGTGGQCMLPLVLDSSIMLTNVGSANPWRRVCRTVTTTAKSWNGVTSAGTTANWVAEGAVTTDNTPTLGALVLTPLKEAVWMTASFEETADTTIAQQVPNLLQDGFDRLEEAAFSVGTGTAQPTGAVVAATVDSNTGLVSLANAASVFPFIIAERLGTTVVFEPLVPGAGGIIPAGIAGWYGYRRVTSGAVTATALRVHNNA